MEEASEGKDVGGTFLGRSPHTMDMGLGLAAALLSLWKDGLRDDLALTLSCFTRALLLSIFAVLLHGHRSHFEASY